MIFNWVNEEITPGYKKRDRMIMIVKSLGITTQRQIKIITNWTESSIQEQLKAVRNIGGKENRDKWLRAWRLGSRGAFVYALGEAALKYAEELKNEFNPHREYYPPYGQARHFTGTNEILCRAIEAGYQPEIWYGQSDTLSQLYYKLLPYKSPVKPDGTIKLKGSRTFFVEFDTGSESGGKIEDRMHRYLELQNIMESISTSQKQENVYPVVWVTYKDSRKAFLQRKWNEALSTFSRKRSQQDKKASLPQRIPQMFFFTEGQETKFLAGEVSVKSLAI